jgi:hypothetical protein
MMLKDNGKGNYGKMTFQEKRINRLDLDNYKHLDPTISSLIPGVNHLASVGTRPLAKGALS